MIGAGKMGFIFLLAFRMFYMQFIQKDEYKTKSDKNRIRIIAIAPVRGQIFDRKGRVLAQNKTCFRLMLEKSGNPNYQEDIARIIELLELDEDQQKELQKMVARVGHSISSAVIDCLEWKQVSVIEERKVELKSLFVDTGYTRYYPDGSSAAHLIGYLGRPKEKSVLADSMKEGKTGIENYYEQNLRGLFGHKQLEVNARGKFVREISKGDSTPGNSLKLNIDSQLQKHTASLLSPQGSSVVVMDCTDGSVLSLNSSPSFDPNQFSKLSRKYWKSLTSNPYFPLINKATHSLYPPGSIFKLVTFLAALEAGHDPKEKIHCSGGPALGGNSFRCSRLSGHGKLSMSDAIKTSCNSYVYAVAQKIGADRIIGMAKKLGLGKKTGIDMPGEKSGFVPTRAWKKKKYGSKWTLGDTFNLAIGQGFLLATPLQLARLITCIASDGKLFTPKIAEGEKEYTQLDIKKEHFAIIKAALYRVMNERGGTGYFSRLTNGAIMSGKTGTAQVQAKKSATDNLSRADIAWHRRNHAIFTGFAPAEDPQYTICVYYDHGGGGGRAATPIAKRVMEKILD